MDVLGVFRAGEVKRGSTASSTLVGASILLFLVGPNIEICIGTFIAQIFPNEARFPVILHKLTCIRLHIAWVTLVRMVGEGIILLVRPTRDIFFSCANLETHHFGVRFLVHRSLAGNVLEFKSKCEHVTRLRNRLKMSTINKCYRDIHLHAVKKERGRTSRKR